MSTIDAPRTVRNATYRQIGGPNGLLARKVPFEGNSMSAILTGRGEYIVYSYATEIAWHCAETGPVVSERKYSTTTSRHQNQCRAWL